MAKKAKSAGKSTAMDAPCGPSSAEMRKYRAEDALRTITRAQEIQRDGQLMRDVKKLASEQVKTLQKVTGRGR